MSATTSRALAWASWLGLAAAVLTAATVLFCRWGVNAEALGARDAGWALSLSFVGAFASIGAFYAAPVLAVLGLVSLWFQRPAGFRFLSAAAVTAVVFLV